MRLIIELYRYSMVISIVALWTKWYLPVHIWSNNYLTSKEITLSIGWLLHFSIRYPSKINKELAQQYLPKYAQPKKKLNCTPLVSLPFLS